MKSFDATWEKIHSEEKLGEYPSESVIRFIARNYYSKRRESVRILDYGCGGGAHTWFLSREGFDVYAFDGSASAVKKTAEKLKKEDLKASLICADALEVEYPDDFFDAVIDNVMIYANVLKNITAMYRNIYRVLKPGGKLYTSMFTDKTFGSRSGDRIEVNTYRDLTDGVLAGRGIVHLYTVEEISGILDGLYFKRKTIDTMDYTDNGMDVSMLIVTAEK